MKFGVIFEIESSWITDRDRPPASQLHKWEQTEAGPSEEHENWQQEKWCALLEEDEFREFLDYTCLHYDGEGRALGPPSPEGWEHQPMPACVFTHQDEEGEQSAYVTPYPMPGERIPGVNTFKRLPLFGDKPFDERDWNLIERHIYRQYA